MIVKTWCGSYVEGKGRYHRIALGYLRHWLAFLFVLSMVANGCAKYVPHPGSVDLYDSHIYDGLNSAQASLDEAKKQYAAGTLSGDTAKTAINKAGEAYNVARDAWLEYRGLKQSGKDATATVQKIDAAMPILAQAIADVKALIH